MEIGRAKPLIASNLNISKHVTLTRLIPVKTEENIISKLKNLPGITLDLVKPEPVFKVPTIPKLEKSYTNKVITPGNKLKDVFEKKILLEKQDDNIIDKNMVIIDVTKTHSNRNKTLKKKNEQIDKNIPPTKKNTNQIIPKNLQKSPPSKYSFSGKENKQKSSTPYKFNFLKNYPLKTKSANSKTLKPAEQVSINSSIAFPGVLNSNSVENSSKIKAGEMLALKSDNEDYTLMDLSTAGQVKIVSASRRDFIDVNNEEYDSFVVGINTSPEYNYGVRLRTSQHFVDPNGLSIDQEFISCFSDLQTNSPTSTNESINNHSGLISLSTKENDSLNCYENVNNILIKGLEYESEKLENEKKPTSCSRNVFKNPQLQINEIHNTMDIPDDNFQQGMEIYFSREQAPVGENKLIDCPKLTRESLTNTEQTVSNIKLNEDENSTKRGQPQNDLRKKQIKMFNKLQ